MGFGSMVLRFWDFIVVVSCPMLCFKMGSHINLISFGYKALVLKYAKYGLAYFKSPIAMICRLHVNMLYELNQFLFIPKHLVQ